MSIARYMPANDDRGCGTVVRNDESGTVVFYDDYAAEVARLNGNLDASQRDCQEFAKLAGQNAARAQIAEAEVARLNEQVQALAALAEERREFIVNGVGLGYIQIPAIPFDKAIDTYERCLLKPKFAADAILNEVRAQGLEEAAEEVDQWVGCDLLAQELRKKASRFRSGGA